MNFLHKIITNCNKIIKNWKVPPLKDFLGRELLESIYEEKWIKTPTGYSIYTHIHHPKKTGTYPGIVIVPGGNSPGTDYDKGNGVQAQDVASCGFVVMHYDPSGRGKTGGKEDHWGKHHQQELAWVLDFFSKLPIVDHDDIGIFSFSIGIVTASGALARYPAPNIKYLFDWEGPSNKFNITKNDTHKALTGFPTSNNDFWDEREAARFIGDIVCGYFRYQAEIDHVQKDFKGHAIEILNNATRGKALWTQCNNNPMNIIFDENTLQNYYWVPSHLNHKGQILKYLLDAHEYSLSFKQNTK